MVKVALPACVVVCPDLVISVMERSKRDLFCCFFEALFPLLNLARLKALLVLLGLRWVAKMLKFWRLCWLTGWAEMLENLRWLTLYI